MSASLELPHRSADGSNEQVAEPKGPVAAVECLPGGPRGHSSSPGSRWRCSCCPPASIAVNTLDRLQS